MKPSPRRLVLVASLLAVPSLAAAAPGGTPPDPPAPITWVRPADSCGTRQLPNLVANPIQRPAGGAATGPRTVYLNRTGGSFHIINGATNSATDSANISVAADGRPRTAVIAPMAADFHWATISACVQAHYAKYDLRFVESRPASGVYVEAVVGGSGTELGFGANQLFGIASADNFCSVTEAGIAFSFSETHRGVPQADAELCATIAHEVGHLLALEHETLATDLMSYVLVSDSASKAFVNQASACGVEPGQNQPCSCTSNSTNSAARLTSFIGLRPVETVPPSLTVVAPDDGEQVPPTFDVLADATDNLEMSDVTVLLDDSGAGSDAAPDGARYVITLANVADGAHTLTVRAHDRAGNEKAVTRAITVARLGIGEACTGGDQCTGGQCVTSGSDTFCTQTCDLANDTCPDGWACTSAGAFAVCAGGQNGGCCDAGQRPGPGTGLLVLGVGLLLVRSRTRRA